MRRARTRTRTSALAAAALSTLLAACGVNVVDGRGATASPTGTRTTTTPPPRTGGTLTWGESFGSIENFMPLIAAGNTTANGDVTARVLDGLYRSSPGITYIADADQGSATSTIVGGQQIVDITINPDAVWADGQPVTADDYIFTATAQRSYDPAKGGCAALLSSDGFDQIARTERVSAKHARLVFSTPYADWKGLFAGPTLPLLSKHVLDKGSPSATCAAITRGWPVSEGIPLGAQNGPWLLTAANISAGGRRITLVPNPRYRGERPRLDRLVFVTLDGTSAAAVAALRNGEVDAIYPQPQLDDLAQLKRSTGITTRIGFGASFEHLDFNARDPLLKNPQIRKAIALAIDRPALASSTIGQFSDRATPLGNRLLLDAQAGYADNSGAYVRQNIAQAKRLIEGAGGTLGSDGIFRIGGRPLALRVMTTQGNALRDQTIATLAAQVRPAGIKLTEYRNPDIFEGPDHTSSLAAHGYQLALFAWVGSPSLSSANQIYLSNGGENYTGGGTADIDKTLRAMAGASRPTVAQAAANAADRLLWDQMLTLPLFQKPTLLAYRSTVDGLRDNPSLAGPLWNSDEIGVR